MIWSASLAAIAGIVTLRIAWGLRQRSTVLNGIGWASLALAVTIGAAAAGAWGVTVATLVALSAASIALAFAALMDCPGKAKVSNRRAGMLPQGSEPLHLSRRVLTFLMVIAGGLVAAIGVALAIRRLSLLLGANEANSNASALFVMPFAWALLMFFLMIEQSRRRQALLLVLTSACALPTFLVGAS